MTDQLCSFQLAGMTFGVNAIEVQEIMRAQPMTRVPLADPAVVGLMNLRGQIVTTIDLRTRLGLAPRSATDKPINVVVRCPDGMFGLLVDSIGDVLEPSRGSFEVIPEHVPAKFRDMLAGAYKLSDRLLFVLELGRVVAA